MMHGVRAVLFDLDETLTDAPVSLAAARRAVAGMLCEYLRGHSVKADAERVYPELSSFDDRMNVAMKYDRDLWWPALLAELGLKHELPREMVGKLTMLYWHTLADTTEPYPDAQRALSYLKGRGYKLGLVTDTDGTEGIKRMRLGRIALVREFDVVVVGGEDTPQSKPSPEPFLLAASKLGLRAGECVMVGDKPFTDIRGAKAAGMRTIWVRRRDWGVREDADFTINSLAELSKIL